MSGDKKTDYWKETYKTYCKNVKMRSIELLSFDEWLRMREDDISRIKEK